MFVKGEERIAKLFSLSIIEVNACQCVKESYLQEITRVFQG
jgi:hypothetical protein